MKESFEEFIFKQCDEIVLADKESQDRDRQIIEMEACFKKKLNPEQINEYNRIEELVLSTMAYNENLIFRRCTRKLSVI